MNETMNLFQRMGCYQPAFFHIHLDTDESICNVVPNTMSPTLLSVFFHEYIHFIQDLTTVSGLQNIYRICEYIKYVLHEIVPQGKFKIPVELATNKYNVRANIKVYQYANGDTKFSESLHINSYSIKKFQDEDLKVNGISSFPCVEIVADEGVFYFGARELMESSAYILQRQCTQSFVSPAFPYSSAEKLAAHICPEVFTDVFYVLALCDACLLTSQPGAVFVKALEHIKQNPEKFQTPESVYDYVFSLRTNPSPLEFFEQSVNRAKDALKSYFSINELSKSIDSWVDCVLDFARDWRLSQKYCLLLLAKDGDLLVNKTFNGIMRRIGSPLISNNREEYARFQTQPDYGEDLPYLYSIMPIAMLLFNGHISCCMKKFCSVSNISVDDRCDSGPWQRCNDAQLCPVACFMKHRKMSNISPYV